MIPDVSCALRYDYLIACQFLPVPVLDHAFHEVALERLNWEAALPLIAKVGRGQPIVHFSGQLPQPQFPMTCWESPPPK